MRKVTFAMALVMMFVFVAGFSVMAQQAPPLKKITAEVCKIDNKAETITVKYNDKEKTLTAAAKMLEGIKAGDKVEIEKEGKLVKSIKKVETPTPAPASAPAGQ